MTRIKVKKERKENQTISENPTLNNFSKSDQDHEIKKKNVLIDLKYNSKYPSPHPLGIQMQGAPIPLELPSQKKGSPL